MKFGGRLDLDGATASLILCVGRDIRRVARLATVCGATMSLTTLLIVGLGGEISDTVPCSSWFVSIGIAHALRCSVARLHRCSVARLHRDGDAAVRDQASFECCQVCLASQPHIVHSDFIACLASVLNSDFIA